MSFKRWCKSRGIKFERRSHERPALKVWLECQEEINSKDRQIKDLLDELKAVGDLTVEISEKLR